MKEQQFLRDQVRMLKWSEGISFKMIAEDLLEMNYNSFINWLHGYCNLGEIKMNKLKEFINCMV